MQGYVFDIEADNLYLQSKKIWIIVLKSLDGLRSLELFPFREEKEEVKRKFIEWHCSFGKCPTVVSFNGIGYDHWMLWKHLDISFHIGKNGYDWLDMKYKCNVVDLYVLSQFIDPDRPRHSLKSYGEELGDHKLDFNDWEKFSDEMLIYCRKDVDVTLDVFNYLTKKTKHLYKLVYGDEGGQYWKPLKSLQKDYYLYSAQAFTGIEFDKESAEKLVKEIEDEMLEIEQEVLPQLPPRKLKEGEKKHYSMPAKPFKKDGSLSSTMEKWIEKHNAKVVGNYVEAYGKQYKIEANKLLDVELPMEIKDGDDIKEWFMRPRPKKEVYELYKNVVWRED